MKIGELALLFDGPEDGARAMARDEVLVEFLRTQDVLSHAFRAHGWLHPTLSVGLGQQLPPELLNEADACGVEVVRRPTGGGWLLHLPGDLALTLAVAGPLASGGLRRAARVTAQAIAHGMAACGRPALVFTGVRAPASRAEVCFMRADRDEVVVGATKVAGVALARLGRSALVQSAAPLTPPPRDLGVFADRWDPQRRAAVEAAGGADREAIWREATEALARMIEAKPTKIDWPTAGLRRAEVLRQLKYRDPAYTRDGRRPHLPTYSAAEGETPGE